MTKQVPYYRVKNGRAYWQPTKAMRAAGFEPRALGEDGEVARRDALVLTQEWRESRKVTTLHPKSSPKSRGGFIYFAFAGSMVKIGFSTTPTARASQLQTAMALPLSAVVILPGDRRIEKQLHARFSSFRSHREWFRNEEPIRRLVMRSVSFGRLMLESEESWNELTPISNSRRVTQLEVVK